MKDYSELTSKIYVQLSPELSQEFHNMLTDMAKEISRLYEIENAKPSEALENLEYIGIFNLETDILVEQTKAYNTIKQALIKAQEQEKVLNVLKGIINSKNGFVRLDKDYIIIDVGKSSNEEEYNLLKGYFEK